MKGKFYGIIYFKQAVQDVDDVHSVRTFDFLLLLVLYVAAPSRRRPIESILRNKIRLGLFSDPMLEKAVTNHSIVSGKTCSSFHCMLCCKKYT